MFRLNPLMTLALFNDFAYDIFYYLSALNPAQKVKALRVSFEALRLPHRSTSHLLKARPVKPNKLCHSTGVSFAKSKDSLYFHAVQISKNRCHGCL